MSIGISGNRVVVMGRIRDNRPAFDQAGITEYITAWQLSEPISDSTQGITITHNDCSLFTSISPTDSEIVSALRILLVDVVNREMAPADPFVEADIRGCSI
jgi:hypothetical protein